MVPLACSRTVYIDAGRGHTEQEVFWFAYINSGKSIELQAVITKPCTNTFLKNSSRDILTLLMEPFLTLCALDHTQFVFRHATRTEDRDVGGFFYLRQHFSLFARK